MDFLSCAFLICELRFTNLAFTERVKKTDCELSFIMWVSFCYPIMSYDSLIKVRVTSCELDFNVNPVHMPNCYYENNRKL